MENVLYAADAVYGLLFLVAGVLAALEPRRDHVRIARNLVIIGSVIVAVRWSTWAVTTEAPWPARGIVGALIGATLFILVPGVLHWLFERQQGVATEARPILRLSSPGPPNLQISWRPSVLFPETVEKKSPFVMSLKNIGIPKAIEIELSFSTPLDIEKLRATLKSSQTFPQMEVREHGNVYVPLEFSLGNVSQSMILEFRGENIRRVAALASDNSSEITVPYPPAIQNLLCLSLLDSAFKVGSQIDVEMRDRVDELRKLMEQHNQRKAEEELQARDRRMTIALPEVDVNITYSGTDGVQYHQNEKIKSVYKIVVSPFWAFENEQRKKLYFNGGSGVLSFEDRDNPDEGFYNRAKRQGLVD
jgi:hypothetical protein